MTYTYRATIEAYDDSWFVSFPDLPAAYSSGATLQEACEGAAESLRLVIAEYLDSGMTLPESRIEDKPEAVFCVEVSDYYIARTKCMTVTEAAEELGVTPSRVSQLLSRGLLDAHELDGQRLVTIESINRRKANPPAPHRPPKSTLPGYRYADDGTLVADPETAPRIKAAYESLLTFEGTHDEAISEAARIINGDDQDNG